MIVRFSFVLALSSVVVGNAYSEDLHCTGRSWFKIGDGFDSTVLLQLDKKSLLAKLTLPHGIASGEVASEPKYYKGMLRLNGDYDVWMTLDRYTGEFIASPPANDTSKKPVYFVGSCEEKKAKF